MKSSALLYRVVATVSFALGVLGSFGGQTAAYDLPWFMIFTATLASVHGFSWGFLAAGLSALALGLISGFSAMDGLLLLLSAGIAHRVGESLRQAHRRARALAKSHRFIAEALRALSGVEHRQDLLKSLPERLSSLGEGGHIGVWVPQEEGFRCLSSLPPLELQKIPLHGVVGRALREGKPQYLPDVRQDPSYIAALGFSIQTELALPLFERGEGVAVLNLERSRPFLNEEVEGLIRFAEAVSLQLDRLADLESRRLITELAVGLQRAHTLDEAAEMALALLLKALELEAGVIWRAQGARMEPLAYQGVSDSGLLRVLQEGLPYGQGLAWEAYRTGNPHYTQTYSENPQGVAVLRDMGWRTLVVHPVPTSGSERSRIVLVVGEKAQRPWRKAEQELLSLFCRTLGVGFERLVEGARHEAMNRLMQELLDKPFDEACQRVLQEAIQQVPGSEAGSLLVLEEGQYRYKAAVGYDFKALQALGLSPQMVQRWYGLGEERAHRGEPRLVSAENLIRQSAPPEIAQAVGEIRANLCLPMAYRGEVLAYLNLDNLHDPRALAEDSLRAAHFFATPIATLLHERRTRRLLEEAAFTDALTGLPNRRAFDRTLPEELERAARYAYPLSLALLDLSGFKAINDRLGHASGDRALITVAQALERERRSGDYLFRWGGDEFAAIFPHTPKEEAYTVALRYAQAIEGIRFGELGLGVNIGLATYPQDGTTPDALLTAADTRMYQAKASGTVVSL